MPVLRRKTIICLLVPLLTGCQLQPENQVERPESWQVHLEPVSLPKDTPLAIRETIYVPVYAHIYYEDRTRLLDLTETVSVRNTDLEHPIILTSVRHYSTDGTLIKNYLAAPVLLKPMATADFVVPRTDVAGGTGANFIVEWVAKNKVTEPIAESVMISTGSAHSISFLSRGTVLKREEHPVLTEPPTP